LKKVFACLVIALSLFATPVIPQGKTPFTIYVASHTRKGDAVAAAFVAEVEVKLKHDLTDGGVLVPQDASESDASGAEIVFMSVPDGDGKGTAILVDVCEHVQGHTYDLLVSAIVGRTSAEEVVDDADALTEYIERPMNQYDQDTAPNTDPKS
jgi:hypothetical protein